MGHGRTADVMDRPFHYHDMAAPMRALFGLDIKVVKVTEIRWPAG
jgi:hypothetical protein